METNLPTRASIAEIIRGAKELIAECKSESDDQESDKLDDQGSDKLLSLAETHQDKKLSGMNQQKNVVRATASSAAPRTSAKPTCCQSMRA